jgi:hypothetical protein
MVKGWREGEVVTVVGDVERQGTVACADVGVHVGNKVPPRSG